MNHVADGFRDERDFEFFFNGWVICFEEFFEAVCDPDDKREGSFKKEDNGRHLCPVTNQKAG